MIEKTIVVYILQLALNYTGYPPLSEDFVVPDVVFITQEALIRKSCEFELPSALDECLIESGKHKLVGLYDRYNPKIYIVETLEKGLNNREPYAVGVLLHEVIHVLQMKYKHGDNPDIRPNEKYQDEIEAYGIQKKF